MGCPPHITTLIALAGLFGPINMQTISAAAAQTATTLSQQDQALADEGIPLAAVDGGPRRWRVVTDDVLDIHSAPSAESAIVETLANGTLLSNTGCERVGSVSDNADDKLLWCRIKPLRGKLLGYALAQHLQPAASPDGTVPVGIDDSASRARKNDFDLSAQIPCAQERGQAMGECNVEVAHGGGGDATLVARFANGFRRTLYFANGEFVSANATMSGSGSDIDWALQGDVHRIRVDDQRFELPNDFIVQSQSD